MVKSKTRRDAEILVRNPSPRLFGENVRDSKKKNKNKPWKNETSRLIKNAFEILPNFSESHVFRGTIRQMGHSRQTSLLPTDVVF